MLSEQQIKHLAKLSRLKLNKEEIENLTQDLNKILDYVKKIEELNLEDLKPLTNIIEKLDFRNDDSSQEQESKIRDEIINNFPQEESSYLKVPKILDKLDI